jgi:hypothetical protein
MEVQSKPFRPDVAGYESCCADATGLEGQNQFDLVMIRMKENGRVTKGYNLNFFDADIDFLVGDNSLFIHDGFYIFGGQSVGFNTR